MISVVESSSLLVVMVSVVISLLVDSNSRPSVVSISDFEVVVGVSSFAVVSISDDSAESTSNSKSVVKISSSLVASVSYDVAVSDLDVVALVATGSDVFFSSVVRLLHEADVTISVNSIHVANKREVVFFIISHLP